MPGTSSFSRRNVTAAVLGTLVLVAAGAVYGVAAYRRAAPVSVLAPPPLPAAPPLAMAAPLSPQPPSFDVVRVTPEGGAVIAGRAAPGASVTVQEGGRVVGESRADASGSWVIAGASLPAGAGELTLSSREADGRTATSEAHVLVVVPGAAAPQVPKDAAPQALAVLTRPAAPSLLLQPPVATPTAATGGRTPGSGLTLGTLDYDEQGAIRFSGTAPPDAPLRVYVDNAPVADVTTGADGRWAVSPGAPVQPGMHALRVDQLTPQGKVARRVETPFLRETLALSQVAAGQVVVQPGQNLWRLARRAYGNGLRYTVIFLANKDQIRNANLIYPGQVFSVPGQTAPSP